MFRIYDTKEKKFVGNYGNKLRCNADRVAQSMNIRQCGIDECDKKPEDRRFVVREMSNTAW